MALQEMVGQAVFVSVDAEATPVNSEFANEMQIRCGMSFLWMLWLSRVGIAPRSLQISQFPLQTVWL